MDKDLLDEFQVIMVAGTDSTAKYLMMMIYYSVKNPLVLKRLREEIDKLFKTEEDVLDYEKLKKATYIDWIQLETTRMFGPGNGIFPRIAIEDNYVHNVPISKGTLVSVQPRGNHYN